jgi:hypothetical protein
LGSICTLYEGCCCLSSSNGGERSFFLSRYDIAGKQLQSQYDWPEYLSLLELARGDLSPPFPSPPPLVFVATDDKDASTHLPLSLSQELNAPTKDRHTGGGAGGGTGGGIGSPWLASMRRRGGEGGEEGGGGARRNSPRSLKSGTLPAIGNLFFNTIPAAKLALSGFGEFSRQEETAVVHARKQGGEVAFEMVTEAVADLYLLSQASVRRREEALIG